VVGSGAKGAAAAPFTLKVPLTGTAGTSISRVTGAAPAGMTTPDRSFWWRFWGATGPGTSIR